MSHSTLEASLVHNATTAAILALIVLGFGIRSADADETDEASGSADTWHLAAGVGAMNGPRYPGSRDYFTHVLPVVSVQYGRYFLGGLPGTGSAVGLGAFLVRNEHWQMGVSLGGAIRKPRRASDDPVLHGWGDIAATERGNVFANYINDWFVVHGDVSADIGGKHEGVLASLSLEGRFHPMERLTLSFGPEITWADTKYSQTFFGIDAAQSVIAGIPQYTAKSGINTLGVTLGADYRLTSHWSVGTHASYGRLQGDAADSPVTTDKTQYMMGAFVMYRFGKQ